MENNYLGKYVIVTGAANGIGKAITEGFSEKGSTVFMVDNDETNGKAVMEDLRSRGRHVIFIRGDVGKEVEVLQVFEEIKKHTASINCIINNAGISKFVSLEELTFLEWERVLHTNLSSVFLFSKYGIDMIKKGGSIINIASTRALMSEENSEVYAASKGGVVSLTHALASSLSNRNIRVNSISPGWIETGDYETLREKDHEQHFSKRVGKPEDIVRACFYLADQDNDFVTGENIVVDGGMTKKMIYEH
ncbi:SDR family oxidoreductase [Evansella tamaricis]|uniref:SDR family oxidoreductase n=1 Tax=Evansella tamaricis TaxID=2069301 RepID=A0ABS6JM59_9BACI|nr:SDR family oxidoreductase [Evansella tamaricis]MBU9714747.1 SDR family oxidoreductase [Evansella tamaricis]